MSTKERKTKMKTLMLVLTTMLAIFGIAIIDNLILRNYFIEGILSQGSVRLIRCNDAACVEQALTTIYTGGHLPLLILLNPTLNDIINIVRSKPSDVPVVVVSPKCSIIEIVDPDIKCVQNAGRLALAAYAGALSMLSAQNTTNNLQFFGGVFYIFTNFYMSPLAKGFVPLAAAFSVKDNSFLGLIAVLDPHRRVMIIDSSLLNPLFVYAKWITALNAWIGYLRYEIPTYIIVLQRSLSLHDVLYYILSFIANSGLRLLYPQLLMHDIENLKLLSGVSSNSYKMYSIAGYASVCANTILFRSGADQCRGLPWIIDMMSIAAAQDMMFESLKLCNVATFIAISPPSYVCAAITKGLLSGFYTFPIQK